MALIAGVKDKFLRYVQIDTQSDPHSSSYPSTEKQKDLGRVLVDELQQMGLSDAHMDNWGYVFATIPSTTNKSVPVICFCAHMDTSPDCSGTDVRPIVHERWDGSDIILPDDRRQVVSIKDHPYLQEKIGEDIITASGTTLLGADDKAGVAIVMQAAEILATDNSIEHGAIKILFTPDEEVGRGVEHLDLQKLGAQYAYTLDGSERGSLEDETFSADALILTVYGISAHPGFAKGKLVNAVKIIGEIIHELPKTGLSPETTELREGFIHPVHMEGTAEEASLHFIIRDFSASQLKVYENLIETIASHVVEKYPGASFRVVVKEQYRNMKDVIEQHPNVTAFAMEAIARAGMPVRKLSVRGGTDGSRLSFMGLPCPNIFTGEMAFHSLQEYVSVQDMEKAVETVIELSKIWAEKS
ncbi:peptidase T [Pollutibacter soli]|uniref:peptidase T n=1 Tax=Pollutibacter soli TaxID=3034157 RepID=UPI003013B7F4